MPKFATQPPVLLRRSVELVAAAIGLFCCVATSDEPPEVSPDDTFSTGDTFVGDVPPLEPVAPEIVADLFIHNGTDIDVVVNLRQLDSWVDLDCDVVARAPGQLLAPELFGTTQSWTLPADANLPVRDAESEARDCIAVWVEGASIEPSIVFWRDGEVPVQTIAGQGVPEVRGGLILTPVDETRLVLDDGVANFVFEPALAEPGVENCEAVPEAHRIEWSSPVPATERLIESIEVGLDGCMELGLVDTYTEGAAEAWYLCISAETFPFDAGDRIRIDSVYGTGSEGLLVESIAGADAETRRLLVARGSEAPVFEDFEISFAVDAGCASAPTGHCGTVGRPGTVMFASPTFGSAEVSTREGAVRLGAAEGAGALVQVYVAQERDVLNAECATGSDTVGADIEFTITFE